MLQFFYMIQQSQLLQICNNSLAAFFTSHAFIVSPGTFVHRPIEIHDHDRFQLMALAHFKVIRVVGRCDFHCACTEFRIDVIISNDFCLSIYQRNDDFLADIFFKAFVIRINRYCRIAHNRFRTGRGNHNIIIFPNNGVCNIPQMPLYIRMINFDITQRGMAVRAPVGNALALINKALFV